MEISRSAQHLAIVQELLYGKNSWDTSVLMYVISIDLHIKIQKINATFGVSP